MIHIVTGKIDSGKSTTIADLYQRNQAGDGFVSIKRMHYHKVHGYDIMRLSTLETRLLVVRDEFKHRDYQIACKIGPYLFLQDALAYVETTIRSLIADGVTPIYLDEIGQLELYDQCFHKVFAELVDSGVECYITVRHDLVPDIIDKYKLMDYDIIEV